MKQLLLLPLLLFFFAKTNAQNGRWMYLIDNKGTTLMVDTLTNDTKQFDTYDGHNNIVVIWVKAIQHKFNKKGSFIESNVVRYAIDTTTNQMEVMSAAVYHNNTPIQSKSFGYLPWEDVIPESVGDVFIRYCRALHNQQRMQLFIIRAFLHDRKSSPKKMETSN